MVNAMIPLYAGSGFFAVMLIFLPLCCGRKGPNKGIIQCSLILSVFSMWIFWATVYISQLNPLIGPRHKNTTLIWYRLALFECCNIPWLPERAQAKCVGESLNILKLTCKEARCAFKEAGWLVNPGVVKLLDVTAFYDRVEQSDPDWEQAVRLIKEECLLARPKYQGTYTDCPEYDILYCATIKLFTYAPLSSWSTATPCPPSQEFLSQCPVCPANCDEWTAQHPPTLMSEPKCQACVPF